MKLNKNPKEVYEAIRKVDHEKLIPKSAKAIQARCDELFRKRTERARAEMAHKKALYQALLKTAPYKSQLKNLPKLDPGRFQEIKAPKPNPPRLPERIVRLGSIFVADTPPFVAHKGVSLPVLSSNNNGVATAATNANTGEVGLGVSVGLPGLDDPTNTGGGTCGIWASMGQFYFPPTTAVLSNFSVCPSIGWNISYYEVFAPILMDFLCLPIIQQFDFKNNLVSQTWGTPNTFAVVNQVDGINTNGNEWTDPVAVPLQLSAQTIFPDFQYYCGVLFMAYGNAAGTNFGFQSTGLGSFNATLPIIQFKVQCPDGP